MYVPEIAAWLDHVDPFHLPLPSIPRHSAQQRHCGNPRCSSRPDVWIPADLHRHISDEGLLYIQFAFRWMNCLLMRELPLRAVVRAWDTYLAEENGFESFHVYVSAALLCHFSSTLREMDFQTMVSRRPEAKR